MHIIHIKHDTMTSFHYHAQVLSVKSLGKYNNRHLKRHDNGISRWMHKELKTKDRISTEKNCTIHPTNILNDNVKSFFIFLRQAKGDAGGFPE